MSLELVAEGLRTLTEELQMENDLAELRQELRDAWMEYAKSVVWLQDNLPPEGDARWSAHHKTHLVLARYLLVRQRCKDQGILNEQLIHGSNFHLADACANYRATRMEV